MPTPRGAADGQPAPPQHRPTARQLQVLRLVAAGYPNKETAQLLGIGPQSVKNLLKAVFQRLGAYDRAHAVVLALKDGHLRAEDIPDRRAPPSHRISKVRKPAVG